MAPYRVILWGFGSMGQANFRAMANRPDLEVVGVLAFKREKVGQDAGTYLELEPAGVAITDDKDALIALNADVVLHSVQDAIDQTEIDDDVIALLESGKSVISSTSYYYPPMRGEAYAQRLEHACRKGNSCLHASGANPGTIVEKLALTLTGYCTEVDLIKVQEFADFSILDNPAIHQMAGFGFKPEEVDPQSPIMEVVHRYYRDPIGLMGKKLFNADPSRIRVECNTDLSVAEEDFEVPGIVKIPKGHVQTVVHHYYGYLDDSDQPFIEIEEFWYQTPENCPVPGIESQSYYIIVVEGKPVSTELRLDAKASILENRTMHDGDPTLPIWYIAGVSMIQAIPVVCSSEPGFVYSSSMTHYADDFHRLASTP